MTDNATDIPVAGTRRLRGKADREAPFTLETTYAPTMRAQQEAIMDVLHLLVGIAVRQDRMPAHHDTADLTSSPSEVIHVSL